MKDKDHPLYKLIMSKEFIHEGRVVSKKMELLHLFDSETDKCLQLLVEFYDEAIKSPLAAKLAMENLNSDKFRAQTDGDILKTKLINATNIISEAYKMYKDYGDRFCCRMMMVGSDAYHITKEVIEQRIQQDQHSARFSSENTRCAPQPRNKKNVSWKDEVTELEPRVPSR